MKWSLSDSTGTSEGTLLVGCGAAGESRGAVNSARAMRLAGHLCADRVDQAYLTPTSIFPEPLAIALGTAREHGHARTEPGTEPNLEHRSQSCLSACARLLLEACYAAHFCTLT